MVNILVVVSKDDGFYKFDLYLSVGDTGTGAVPPNRYTGRRNTPPTDLEGKDTDLRYINDHGNLTSDIYDRWAMAERDFKPF